MKYILLIAFSFGFLATYAQQADPDLEEKDLIMYFKGEDKPYTGPVSGYHENGQIGKEGNYKHGRMERT